MSTTKSLFKTEGLDERSLEFLTTALEKSNLPGFDYLEFKRAVADLLSNMNMDEATAYKSAFTTVATTLGLTKGKLVETAGYYRNVVGKEKEKFDESLTNHTQTKVVARQEEIKRLRDQVERHRADIARLQDEVAAYLSQIDQAEKTAAQETDKLTKAKSSFETTHSAVLLQMDRDIENIHRYL